MKRKETRSPEITDPALDAWMHSAAQIVIAILTRRNQKDDDGMQAIAEDTDENC